eukprot:5027896-Pleurochrysis_carterae.AAC.1
MAPPPQRRRLNSVAFAALRPPGMEDMLAAELLRAIEGAMGGSGKVAVALAEAAGRPSAIAAL